MTAKEFYDAVCRMRTLQKDYFKYRQPEDLRKSRQAEKIIDEEIHGNAQENGRIQ